MLPPPGVSFECVCVCVRVCMQASPHGNNWLAASWPWAIRWIGQIPGQLTPMTILSTVLYYCLSTTSRCCWLPCEEKGPLEAQLFTSSISAKFEEELLQWSFRVEATNPHSRCRATAKHKSAFRRWATVRKTSLSLSRSAFEWNLHFCSASAMKISLVWELMLQRCCTV